MQLLSIIQMFLTMVISLEVLATLSGFSSGSLIICIAKNSVFLKCIYCRANNNQIFALRSGFRIQLMAQRNHWYFCKWPPTFMSVCCTFNQLNVYVWYANIWHVPLGIVSHCKQFIQFKQFFLFSVNSNPWQVKMKHFGNKRRRVNICKVLKWSYKNTYLF